MINVYGIKNCDTVKKARKWLEDNGIQYEFHDFKAEGVDAALLNKWIGKVGWEALLNTRGTTWRKLPQEIRDVVKSEKAARTVMIDNNSIIKRPVVEVGGEVIVGFDEGEYRESLRV